MTNLEAIQLNVSDVHGVALTEGHFRKALIDSGVNPLMDYTNPTAIDRATLRIYDLIISGANFSEGGMSYNVNIEGIKNARDRLAEGLGSRKDTIKSERWW
jgi:hypothetical protein